MKSRDYLRDLFAEKEINEAEECTLTTKASAKSSEPVYGIVTGAKWVNLRNSPMVDENVVTQVQENVRGEIKEEIHGFYKMWFPNGPDTYIQGFMDKQYVKKEGDQCGKSTIPS